MMTRTIATAPTLDTTETYASAYATLTQIADKLRTGGQAAGVDEIVDDLRAARAAYAICKARLDAIRGEVDAELEAVEA